MWADVGVLDHDAGGWTLTVEPEFVPVPATVQSIYVAQLDDLPDHARTAARRAVAGRQFPRAACEPLGIDRSDDALQALERRAFIDGPHDDVLLGASFAVPPPCCVTRATRLSRAERSLHCRLADWLTSLPVATGSLAEVIGRHYATALEGAPALVPTIDGRSREVLRAIAARWFEHAAVALRLAAWETARELAERSLALDEAASPSDRGRRLELCAEATASAVGVDPAIALLEQAIECHRVSLAANPPAAKQGLASAGFALGTLLRAQTWFARASSSPTSCSWRSGPRPTQAPGLGCSSCARMRLSTCRRTHERAERDARLALDLARAADDRSLELDAEQALAQVLAERDGRSPEATLLRIEELGREQRWSSVAAALRTPATRIDDELDALALYDRAADVCSAHGLVEAAAWCDYGRAEDSFGVIGTPHSRSVSRPSTPVSTRSTASSARGSCSPLARSRGRHGLWSRHIHASRPARARVTPLCTHHHNRGAPELRRDRPRAGPRP